jgi:hypothetical protein
MLTIQKKSLSVGQYVSTAHVDKVIRTYKKERWVHNSERIGKADSLSGWYSLEELEEFVDKVKSHGGDGVRLYFSAYPHNYTETPEYADRQTVVLVATKSKGNGQNKDLYITDGDQTNILAYNSMKLCPPFCGPTLPDDGSEWGGLGVALIDQGKKGLSVI